MNKKLHIMVPLAVLLIGALSCRVDFEGSGSGDNGRDTTCDSCASLVFAGDVMLGGNVELEVTNNHAGDYTGIFANIAEYMSGFDVAFCNLESMISNQGIGLTGYRAKPAALGGLVSAGIDIVSVANDHALDYMVFAFSDCLERLAGAGIIYAGGGADRDEASDVRVFDIKGSRIALLAFTAKAFKINEATNSPKVAGVAYLESINDVDLENGIWDAINMDGAQVVIVSLHFGSSLETSPSDEQRQYARKAIDLGADMVVGHNPNVIQPVERYNGGIIAYSLGNLVHDTTDEKTLRGMLLEVIVHNGAVTDVRQRYVVRNASYQPELEVSE